MYKHHLLAWLCLTVSGCQTVATPLATPTTTPARFLLTFDDGPSSRSEENNTTLQILQQLDSNDVQPGVKALFFVQTRNAEGGGSEMGKRILRLKHHTGHAIGLHSGTERGHIRHTRMPPEELAASLRHGKQDLYAITNDSGKMFVRPPAWSYNEQTVALYAEHDFDMLLTDVNTRDGSPINNLFGLRDRIQKQLEHARQAIARGQLPEYRGAVPIIVSFHDLKLITADNIADYLKLLTNIAADVGLTLSSKPFYDNREEILEAAQLRAITPVNFASSISPRASNPRLDGGQLTHGRDHNRSSSSRLTSTSLAGVSPHHNGEAQERYPHQD